MTIFYTKKIFWTLLISLFFFESAFAQKSITLSCNNNTLKGTYLFYVSGALFINDEYVPEAYAAYVTYDGRGNLILNKTSSINGVWAERITQATYQIDPDCTGVATYPTGLYSYYVDPDGQSLTFVKVGNRNDDSQVFTQSLDRISGSANRISKPNISISR